MTEAERTAGAGVGAATVMAFLAAALALGAAAGGAGGAAGEEAAVARLKAVEIARPAADADEAVLGKPLALAFDGNELFAADAQDCAIKVYSRDGRFLRAFGRKGRGPGELSFPSGVAVRGGTVYVADKLNSRIQAFDRGGVTVGSFPTRFLPDRVYALAGGLLLVTGNPTGTRKGEALLHIFDAPGRLRWEGLEASFSGDPVYDAFSNMILVCPAEGGDFHVVHRSGERTALRFASTGALVGRIAVDGRHRSLPLDLPFKGRKKRLSGFCWAAAGERGLLYLSAPAPADGRDLGPGREISVVDGKGRLTAVIELGRAVHRFAVAGERIFAVDDEGELRIFAFGPPAGVRICAGLDEAAPPGTGPTLLVFFSTDCPVCYEELFEARYLVEKGRWPVAVIGVSSGPREALRELLEKHAWTLPVVLDARKALVKRFKAGPAPFKALLVGGEVAYRDDPYLGLEKRRKELERCLTRLFSR